MTTSDNGLAFIEEQEGFRASLYNDKLGNCTIGYGHLVHLGPIDGRASEQPWKVGLTQAAAAVLLRRDVKRFESGITRKLRVELEQNQFDALVSFVYNVGLEAFAKSTLLKKLNAGDYAGAALELERWDHGHLGGKVVELADLKARRKAEEAMFSSATYEDMT